MTFSGTQVLFIIVSLIIGSLINFDARLKKAEKRMFDLENAEYSILCGPPIREPGLHNTVWKCVGNGNLRKPDGSK